MKVMVDICRSGFLEKCVHSQNLVEAHRSWLKAYTGNSVGSVRRSKLVKMSHREVPRTVILHKTREYRNVDPSKPRVTDDYESEGDIDGTNCDRPQPDDTETFANNPQWLRDHDRRDYRRRRIEQILKDVCVRNKDEPFDIFIERAYCDAHVALKRHGKGEYGNDYPTLLDRWVCRFVKGFKLISRLTGKKWIPSDELMLTKLVREECEILTKQDEVFVDHGDKTRKVTRAWEPVKPDNYPPGSSQN